MATCKLTGNIGAVLCAYVLAGAKAIYLANWYPAMIELSEGNEGPEAGVIVYRYDADGYIVELALPTGEKFYKLHGADDSMSFTDTLLAGANGGRYRQHQIGAVVPTNDIDTLGGADAMSLGTFIAVVIAADGKRLILGRTNGLKAPAGGFDYNSGAAPADAVGWTVLMQGLSTEAHVLLAPATEITPVQTDVIVP